MVRCVIAEWVLCSGRACAVAARAVTWARSAISVVVPLVLLYLVFMVVHLHLSVRFLVVWRHREGGFVRVIVLRFGLSKRFVAGQPAVGIVLLKCVERNIGRKSEEQATDNQSSQRCC